MAKILVEGKFGHGAKKRTRVGYSLRRILRPKLGKSSIPFDWAKGYSSIANIGTIPIKNQFSSDSCAGQSASYAMAIAFGLLSGTYTELSAKSIYSLIFYPNGGSTKGSIENVLKRDGATLESEVPSYPPIESNLESTSWKTPLLVQSALSRSGFKPLTVNLDMDSIAEAVRDYGWVIIQINGQNGNTPDWLSPNPQSPQKNNPNPIWSHFICVVKAQLINNVKTLVFLNSWGSEVGMGGLQDLTQAYFDSKMIVDAFTAVCPVPIAPQSLTEDATSTVLTAQETDYFKQAFNWCYQALARLFG